MTINPQSSAKSQQAELNAKAEFEILQKMFKEIRAHGLEIDAKAQDASYLALMHGISSDTGSARRLRELFKEIESRGTGDLGIINLEQPIKNYFTDLLAELDAQSDSSIFLHQPQSREKKVSPSVENGLYGEPDQKLTPLQSFLWALGIKPKQSNK